MKNSPLVSSVSPAFARFEGAGTSRQSLLYRELLAWVEQIHPHPLNPVYDALRRKVATLEALKKTAVNVKR